MQVIRKEILRHLPRGREARRLFHGRGRCFPGYEDLVIDAYPPVVMVILYAQRSEEWLEELAGLLAELLPERPVAILLQERHRTGSPGRLLLGELPSECDALEDGLRFRLRLGEAQNVGFFPDMAVGRRMVRARSQGKKVLNLFAYTCSFSVAALSGGAGQVVNLDMNRGALELGRFNHELNGLDPRSAGFLPLELFKSLGRLRKLGPFDLVICDPPASQGESFTAERHWPKLLRALPGLLVPGGEFLACNNAPRFGVEWLDQQVKETLPTAELLEHAFPGEDFPEAERDSGVSLHLYRWCG